MAGCLFLTSHMGPTFTQSYELVLPQDAVYVCVCACVSMWVVCVYVCVCVSDVMCVSVSDVMCV